MNSLHDFHLLWFLMHIYDTWSEKIYPNQSLNAAKYHFQCNDLHKKVFRNNLQKFSLFVFRKPICESQAE